jgi:hypothetical protein
MSQTLDQLSDLEVIALCKAPNVKILSGPDSSSRVLHILPDIVVKVGRFVIEEEYLNQKAAFKLLDPSIVRVPVAHRFIEHGQTGYLVMDFADGAVLSLCEAKSMSCQLGKVLLHLHDIQGDVPGPLGRRGAVKGVLWPDEEDIVFNDTKRFEEWMTERLMRPGHQFTLRGAKLVMCHLDFVPRNILVKNGTITLLDWASAGYFPRVFEHITYKFSPWDADFFKILEPHLEKLGPEELESARNVVHALKNSQIYRLLVMQSENEGVLS